jgi:hypothetical protein
MKSQKKKRTEREGEKEIREGMEEWKKESTNERTEREIKKDRYVFCVCS